MPGAAFRWTDESASKRLGEGATLLSSFPSAGLAATVAAHYMIRTLKLPRIGAIESPDFPPVAVVQNGEVQPPVRIYGRDDLGVVMSEFPPTTSNVVALANAVIEGAEEHKVRTVIGLEGVVPHPVDGDEEGSSEKSDEIVWAAVSRRDASVLKNLESSKIRLLEDGVIGGVSGALLVGALHRSTLVTVLLVSARDTVGFPDHRAGAALIEALDRLLPELKLDTGPLRGQAEMIEQLLRTAMRKRVDATAPPPKPTEPTMYQ